MNGPRLHSAVGAFFVNDLGLNNMGDLAIWRLFAKIAAQLTGILA